MGKLTEAIKHLLIINVLFYAATYAMPNMQDRMFELFALFYPESNAFKPWQFLTHMFMHGGLMHIVFNMYALWAFGSPLEKMWGRNKFLFFYFSAGFGAAIIYTGVNYYQFSNTFNDLLALGLQNADIQNILSTGTYNSEILNSISESKLANFYQIYRTPAVGASGAIYGVLVAFGMSFPNSKLALIFFPVPVAAKYFIPVLIGLDLFSGVTGFSIFGQGIAHFAHIGGALIGFIIMMYWKNNQFKRWDK